jgi:aminopeptidase-like protein
VATENSFMNITQESFKNTSLAEDAMMLMRRLFPLCRSITGKGLRQTLSIIGEIAPLNTLEFPTGTPVFDWTIPREWVIRDAFIADESGQRLVDFQISNVHVVNYSVPVNRHMSLTELEPYLHSLPNLPDAIPYRTSYYEESWGFCLSEKQRALLNPNSTYHVVIDSELIHGSLSIGEVQLRGVSEKEFLISTYCCHPSLANDNLSGPVVAAFLCANLAKRKLRHSYRFVFLPETIGAITYCAHYANDVRRMSGGFVITSCGGPGPFGIKESFLGNHLIDRVTRLVMRDAGITPITYKFAPDGSDERQYSSPGFRVAMVTISKDKYYEYDYYHTSLDNLDFVSGEALAASTQLYLDAIYILEENCYVRSLNPNCEAQLGRRGLYPQIGGGLNHSIEDRTNIENEVDVISWILFLADGQNDLLTIAERSGLPFRHVAIVVRKLTKHGLIDKL